MSRIAILILGLGTSMVEKENGPRNLRTKKARPYPNKLKLRIDGSGHYLLRHLFMLQQLCQKNYYRMFRGALSISDFKICLRRDGFSLETNIRLAVLD